MMAAEEGLPVVTSEEISGNTEFSGSALLIVIGEPFSDDHKELIVERITKALQSWDAGSSGLDVNAELESIAQAAPAGTEGTNGERVIEHYSDVLQVDILINPEINTFTLKLKSFLKKNVAYRHMVYSGHYFHGSGSWVLQDDWFSFPKFVSLFKEPDVDAAMKNQTDKVLAINVFNEGDWVPSNLAKHSFGKILEVRINPGTKLDSMNGVLQFSAYLSYLINPVPVKELLKASDVVGNIRFSRPTLYIFPGFQGDSALFGISGFNLLVNGGYGRKACFWDFTRHLDRIDAFLLSHLSEDNLFGASAVLERKARENVHPEIGFVYFNALDEKQKGSPNGDIHPEDGGSHKPASLSIDLIQEGNKMVENIKCINQEPHPCLGRNLGTTLQPINLYHKVGHGSLDMYVLNPLQDNKEMKEFLAQWGKHASTFSSKNGIPLPHLLSIAALLVWKPSSPSEKITRILFPGSVPQAKLFDGMDKLKTVEMFKHAECSEESLKAPQASKVKKTTGGRMPPVPKQPSSPSVGRNAKKDKDGVETKEAPAIEKRKPIAKPDSFRGKPARKADKKTATKSSVDSDAKSTSSVESPSPHVTEEVMSPAESTSTRDSAVLATSEASIGEVKDTQNSEIPELVPTEPVEKTNGAPEVIQENMPDLEADRVNIAVETLMAEKFAEEEVVKESPTQPSLLATTPLTDESGVSLVTPVAEMNVGEALVDSSPQANQDVEAIRIDDVQLEEKEQSYLEEKMLFESPDALPDPELLKDQSIHAEEDDIELPSIVQSLKDDEKDIDTTEWNAKTDMEDFVRNTEKEQLMSESKFVNEEGNREQMLDVSNQPDLVDVSPSDKQITPDEPTLPSESCRYTYTEEPLQSEMKEDDYYPINKDHPFHNESLVSTEADPVEIGSPVEGQTLDMNKVSDDACKDEFAKPDGSSLETETPVDDVDGNLQMNPAEMMRGKPDGYYLETDTLEDDVDVNLQMNSDEMMRGAVNVVPAETEPFDGAKPEGLPLPDEPDIHIEEPCELDDVIKMSELVAVDTSVEKKPNKDLDDSSFLVIDEQTDTKLAEHTDVAIGNIIEAAITASTDHDSLRAEPDLKTSPDEQSIVADVDEAEVMRTSEAELPDQFTSEDLSTTDIMKDSIENPFAEEDSLNVSKDSLLDGDHVAEMVPTEKFDEISDAPKEIPVPECDLYSPTNPFMGMSPGEPTESQITNENGEHIPFAAETPPSESMAEPDSLMEAAPSESIAEPDSLMEDVPQQDLPYDLLGQMQQVNASLVDYSENGGEYNVENNQNVRTDDTVDEFDPLREWGQPMGLPAPTPDSEKAAPKTPRGAGKVATSKARDGPSKSGSRLTSAPAAAERRGATDKDNGEKKSALKTRVGAKKPASAPPSRSVPSKGSEPKADVVGKKPAGVKPDETRKAPGGTATSKRMSMGVGRRATPPVKDEHPTKEEKKPASKLNTSRRPATSSATKVTAPPVKLLPVVPFYVDLTYIPHHGDSDYVNINYFRRVRARYYVYSALRPDVNVLQSLLDAKQTWDDPMLEVTVIPTYDTDTLRLWITQNRDKLASLKVDIAPSASRCTIQLQDHETSCAAYRLEF